MNKRPRELYHESHEPSPKEDATETQTAQTETVQTETAQTELNTSFANTSIDDENEEGVVEEDVYFDMTPYGMFAITEPDARRLGVNNPLTKSVVLTPNPDNKYTRVGEFRQGRRGIFAAGASGFVMEGTYGSDRKPCIAKVINLYVEACVDPSSPQRRMLPYEHNVIQEALIQAILYEETREATGCTKIPQLFQVIRTNGLVRTKKNGDEWILDPTCVETKEVMMVIMEKIDTDAASYIRRLDPGMRSRVCAGVLLEISSLFLFLGRKHLNFMHADLKLNNITFHLLLTTRRTRRFKTYLIDFGMSSLDYKGVRIGAGVGTGPHGIFGTIRFNQPRFVNPYTDLTYLVWSMWQFLKCDMTLHSVCDKYTPLFGQVLRFMLLSSGIPFQTERAFDNISNRTFRAMLTSGMNIAAEEGPTLPERRTFQYTTTPHVKTIAITPEQIQHYAKLYIKAVASPHDKKSINARQHLEKITALPTLSE